ncbi:MAG: hypothetical protein IJE68_01740 [Clostridia bacterium]|nr:hypothetical protein [Clostridia bacterium]
MENAVEALKIAFAVMMFVLALTLSISSFSQASSAIQSIANMRDRETEYTYVNPSEDLTRTVGIETVVTSMYRAFEENIVIYFMQNDAGTPLPLYYDTETTGKVKKDNKGNPIKVACIELSNEGFASKEQAQEHLDIILGGEKVLKEKSQDVKNKYINKLIHTNGLYKYLKNAQFTEHLGEYYEGEGASQIKKRVITYVLQSL